MVYGRDIHFHGADSDFMYFGTPSWSYRKGIVHEIVISKDTGEILCSCEDCCMRKKRGNVLDPESKIPCKHIRKLLESMSRIIKEGIETAHNA